ncbi:MAG: DUF58 domain-containing protein [Planctomycetaceae bacterium]
MQHRPPLLYAAMVAALLLSGMWFGASLWLLSAYAGLALVGGSLWLASQWHGAAIAMRRSGPTECEIGESFEVSIEITSRSRLPIAWLLVEDLFPASAYLPPAALEIDGSRIEVMMLQGGESRRLEYRIHCRRRGYFQIGPTVLETGDLMGLSRRYRLGAAPQYVMVLPRVVALTDYDVASARPVGEIQIRDALIQDTTRMLGIRQWQIGDPMRSDHWPATARTGTLHTKIYEPTTIAGATLVLDLHRDTNPPHHEPVRSDLAITLAASIAAALHEQNQPFALLSNGRDAVDRIRDEGIATDFRTRDAAKATAGMKEQNERLRPVILPSDRGPVHYREVLRQLARLELSDGLPIAETILGSQSRLARDTTLIVILQQCPASTAAMLIGMKRRGWAIAVVINTQDINDYIAAAGPFQAANIPVAHLADENSLPEVTRRAAVRG